MRPRRSFKRVERKLASGVELLTDAETSIRMGRVRQRHTAPEMVVRRACAALNQRYRLSNHDLPGSPDLANRSRHWAIFVHGCFWHHHVGCRNATVPKSNRSFWQAKFRRNQARDDQARWALTRAGYAVLTVWECQTRENASGLAELLRSFFRRVE